MWNIARVVDKHADKHIHIPQRERVGREGECLIFTGESGTSLALEINSRINTYTSQRELEGKGGEIAVPGNMKKKPRVGARVAHP